MDQNRPLTAAAYIRVSTEDQTEYSPEAQKKALRRYASDHGMVLEDRYIFLDEGISGRTAAKRPAFLAMIAQAKARSRPFDVILVHRFDRFARSREDSVVYKSMLRRECGVRVISITEPMEDDKFSVILEAMLEAMAEYYSINLSDEVRKGMTEKALRGELQSAPAFGYAAQEGALVPVPQEAWIVTQLFQRYAAGGGLLDLAKWANAMGARTHRGNPFTNRTVAYILANPVYTGKLRWTPAKASAKDGPPPQAILAEGRHPPLVSPQLWEAVQQKRNQQKAVLPPRARATNEKKHWLCGLIRCASCGKTLAAYPSGPHKRLYFKCRGYAGGSCPHQQHIRADLVEAAFLSQLAADAQAAPGLAFSLAGLPDCQSPLPSALEGQIAQTARKIARLREAFLAGAESPEDYRAVKQSLERRLASLKERQAAPTPPPSWEASQAQLSQAIRATLETLSAPAASPAEKYTAAAAVVAQCTFQRKPEPLLSMIYRLTF